MAIQILRGDNPILLADRHHDLAKDRYRLIDRYLVLLQDCLTGSIYEDPPLKVLGQETFDPVLRQYGWDWPSRAHTMIGRVRMANIRSLAEQVLREEIPGDFIETGVWRGGACILMRGVLEAFGVTRFLARLLRHPLAALGIPAPAAFLWIVANTLGLGYGAGVLIDHVDRGRLTRREADVLNYHIAVSHSLLEDTCLYAAVGVPVFWITVPRLALAGLAVWLRRLVAAGRAARTRPRGPADPAPAA